MSSALRHCISSIAAMVGILVLGIAVPARADLEIQISTDGGATFTKVAFGSSGTSAALGGPATYGGITFTQLSATSNSPGTSALSKVIGANLDAINNTSSAATVYIRIGDTGYTAPTTPPPITVNSHIGGSVVGTNSGNALTFQSYVNQDDSQNGVTGTTTGPQTPGVTTLSFLSDAFGSISSLSSGYSLTEQFILTLGASGGELGFQSNTSLSPVPEPSSLAIAGLGALGLIGYGIRRRKGA